MQSIGEKLEEARKRQGISIREAAEATKIRADFLIDFENNRFGQDLPDIYKRGFIKIYARFLRMDAEKAVSDFVLAYTGHSSHKKEKNSLGEVEVESYQNQYTGDTQSEENKVKIDQSVYWKTGIILILVILFMGVVALVVSVLTKEASLPDNSSDSATTTTTGTSNSEGSRITQPNGRKQIILVATGNTDVLIRDATNKQNVIYKGSLVTGQKVPLELNGKLEVISTEVQNIQVERDGGTKRFQGTGTGKFFIE